MPFFYDPIELEDIDINDSAARFYIIAIPADPKNNNVKYQHETYKFCATTQNLDSQQMSAGDPETKIKYYWPITKEQLKSANLEMLFPKEKLRATPFDLSELNAAFKFTLSFDPGNPKSTFGQKHTSTSQQVAHDVHIEHIRQHIEEWHRLDRMREEMYRLPLETDRQWTSHQQQYIRNTGETDKQYHDRVDQHERNRWAESKPYGAPSGFGNGTKRFSGAPEDLMQQATQTGFFSPEQLGAIKFLLQVNICEDAIRQNLIVFSDFKQMDAEKISNLAQSVLGNQDVMDAIQNRVFTIQDFLKISNHVIPKLGMAISSHQSCLDALREGRTTIKALADLAENDPQEFWQAVNSNDYPRPDSSKCNIM